MSRRRERQTGRPPQAHPREVTHEQGSGVWTSEDCALVLIDYQKEMIEVIRSETSPADLQRIEAAVPAGAAAGSRYAEFLMGELDSERNAA